MQRLTTLDNGLRIVSRTMPSVETVAVGLQCDAGSRRENGRENGLAHLYEHMVFKGAGGRSARDGVLGAASIPGASVSKSGPWRSTTSRLPSSDRSTVNMTVWECGRR